MRRDTISWWLLAAGTVLIVLSWFEVVSPNIQWFAYGMVATLLWNLRPRQSVPPAAAEAPKTEQKNGDHVA